MLELVQFKLEFSSNSNANERRTYAGLSELAIKNYEMKNQSVSRQKTQLHLETQRKMGDFDIMTQNSILIKFDMDCNCKFKVSKKFRTLHS